MGKVGRNILVFLLGLWCFQLHAQDTIMLHSVEVMAERNDIEVLKPLVAKKLDTLVLQSKSTSSLSDLLIQHSPVFIKTYGPGGTSTASFRGTTASHTLVLWNGFQLNAPNLGQVDFSTIPVFLADDVSLNWGSGTSNNSGGLGGAVNIDNTHHFGDGFLLDLKQTYGSFNTLGSFITVGNYGKKFSFRVKAYRNSSDNDFEYENLATIPHEKMRQRNADFVDYGVMPEMSVLLGKSVISVASWNQWNNRNLPPIMPNVFNVNSEEWTRDNFSRNFVSFKTYWESGSLQIKSAAFVENQRYFLLTRNPVTDDTVTFINSENHALILHQIANLDQHLYKSWNLKAKLQWDNEQVRSNNYVGQKRRNVVSAYVAINGEYAGHIVINDRIKPDSAAAIAELTQLGVTCSVMLTGDREEVAADVAGKLALSEYHAGLLPDGKVAEVERLLTGKRAGSTLAFVGDGINDAPVLALADVGIAMGGLGSDAAIEAADVVIMDDKPSKVALAIRIARRTIRIARQNVIFAIGVKIAVLLLAAFGIASMWMAVFADVGVTVLAVLNAIRALRV